MEAFNFQVILLVGLCVSSSFAFPPTRYTQDASFQSLANTGRSEIGQQQQQQQQQQQKSPAEEPQQVNTIRVTCHPDSLEIVIRADMFAVGAPVDADEIRLGVETNNQYCRATASSADEYSISVGLVECGTRHWVTEDSLIYTNLLIYSPEASPYGVVRMDEAVIPIECHYERKYSVSSSSLMPTWIPFMSTQAAVEMLQFNLRIMTSDWQYKRSSNVFHLGEPISIEASVRIGHHMGLRVFVSSCVATLSPDMNSSPRHAFIENGCFVDSQLPGSRSQFLARTQDDKLHMSIDAFRFYNEDRGELYITCHLNAEPINDADATNKACTFVNGRWRSADGNDYLCGQCKRSIEVEQTPSKPSSPSKFRPRGFVKPEEREPLWRSGLKTSTVWEHQARVGPLMVLPAKQKSRPIPAKQRSSILDQISRSTMYGSQWRSGINRVDQRKGLLPDSSSTQNQVAVLTLASEQNQDGEDKSGTEKDEDAEEVHELLEKTSPEAHLQSKAAVLNGTDTAALDEVFPTAAVNVAVPPLSNTTATVSDLSETMDPKRK
uniref:Zona pellucida sperm-binding protein 3 n=1 Tax=Dissostichus mawsoni TaxID=36200 RepID=A0A0U2ZTB3_DISMA|nr:zona pellucida protein ZPC5 isoform 4 [Dissostichus mawsoni]